MIHAGRTTLLLVAIVILAAVLRLWNLSSNPPSLTWDEASLGYNAYSILQTGKDEYGRWFPLNLKSFGDYKPALYSYLVIPFITILGLTELAIRIPSAILGVLTVILTYFLSNHLFKDKRLSLFSALMMAISPLSIQFSRPAFEATVALFLNMLGALLFLKGKKYSYLFIISAICFVLSVFTYQSSRLFVPLLIFGLHFLYRDSFKRSRGFLIALVILVTGALVLGFGLFVRGESLRLAAVSLFSYQRPLQELEQISKEDGLGIYSLPFQVLHGDWFYFLKGIAERFLIYLSPKMLFVDGDYSPRHGVVDLGVLYYFDIFLLPLGVIYLVKRFEKTKLIFYWMLISILPAVLSRDLTSFVRAFNISLPFAVLSASGLVYLLERFNSGIRRKVIAVALFFIILANFAIFVDRYFIHTPIERSNAWVYGYKQAAELAGKQAGNYNEVVFTDSYGQPYIYYLLYNRYSPEKFQKQAVLEQIGVDVGTVRKIDNVSFRYINWPEDRGSRRTLFIGTPIELPLVDILPFPNEFKLIKEIKFLNGTTALYIVEII